MTLSLIAAWVLAAGSAPTSDVGPLVQALWLVQRYGTAEAADPANDQRLKGLLFKALGKEGELTLKELGRIYGHLSRHSRNWPAPMIASARRKSATRWKPPCRRKYAAVCCRR